MDSSSVIPLRDPFLADQTAVFSSPQASAEGQMGASAVTSVASNPSSLKSILSVKGPTYEQKSYFKDHLIALANKNMAEMEKLLTTTAETQEAGKDHLEASLLKLYLDNSKLLSQFRANVRNLTAASQKKLRSLCLRNDNAYQELLYDRSVVQSDLLKTSDLFTSLGMTIPTSRAHDVPAVSNHKETCLTLVEETSAFVREHAPLLLHSITAASPSEGTASLERTSNSLPNTNSSSIKRSRAFLDLHALEETPDQSKPLHNQDEDNQDEEFLGQEEF